jgi:hypothetical protein
MTGRILRFSPIALVLVAAACGGGGGKPATTTTAPAASTSFRAYFLRGGKVQPVERSAVTSDPTRSALEATVAGPTAKERSDLGLTNELRGYGTTASGYTVENPSQGALAQLVYGATQLAGHGTVEVNGRQYTRSSFESLTPAILVELPLPFATVSSPLRLAGTANTFEATFQYELVDPAGKVLAKHFVTATSGSGVRGTYDVKVPFTGSGPATLTVYESSAATGKRINQIDIPVALQP